MPEVGETCCSRRNTSSRSLWKAANRNINQGSYAVGPTLGRTSKRWVIASAGSHRRPILEGLWTPHPHNGVQPQTDVKWSAAKTRQNLVFSQHLLPETHLEHRILCAFLNFRGCRGQKNVKFRVPRPLQSVASALYSPRRLVRYQIDTIKEPGAYSSFPFPHLSPLSRLGLSPFLSAATSRAEEEGFSPVVSLWAPGSKMASRG